MCSAWLRTSIVSLSFRPRQANQQSNLFWATHIRNMSSSLCEQLNIITNVSVSCIITYYAPTDSLLLTTQWICIEVLRECDIG